MSTAILVSIGLFDLVSSLIWLHSGYAEGNPIFSRLAAMGALPFAAAKLLLLAGPVVLLEFVRTKHPKSAEQGTWIAVVAYLALYLRHLVDLYA